MTFLTAMNDFTILNETNNFKGLNPAIMMKAKINTTNFIKYFHVYDYFY